MSIQDLELRARRVCRRHSNTGGKSAAAIDSQLASMFNTCVYKMTKPKALAHSLIDNEGLDESRAQVLAKVWEEQAKGLVERARCQSVTMSSPINAVDVIEHDVTVGLCPASLVKGGARSSLGTPMTAIRFGRDKVIEFGPDDLRQLYDTLETIQAGLDSLK